MGERYTVNVTYLHSGDTFQSVIEDIPNAPRYEGTLEEARELVLSIARGMRPCRLVQDAPFKWTLYALNSDPAIRYELVLVPDVPSENH